MNPLLFPALPESKRRGNRPAAFPFGGLEIPIFQRFSGAFSSLTFPAGHESGNYRPQLFMIALKRLICQGIRRILDLLQLDVVIPVHSGAGRHQLTDNYVLLQAQQRVNLTLDSGVGEHSGGLLERGG